MLGEPRFGVPREAKRKPFRKFAFAGNKQVTMASQNGEKQKMIPPPPPHRGVSFHPRLPGSGRLVESRGFRGATERQRRPRAATRVESHSACRSSPGGSGAVGGAQRFFQATNKQRQGPKGFKNKNCGFVPVIFFFLGHFQLAKKNKTCFVPVAFCCLDTSCSQKKKKKKKRGPGLGMNRILKEATGWMV